MDFANIIYTIFKKEVDKSTTNMNGLDIHYKFNDNSSVNGNVYSDINSDINSSILSESMNHNNSMEIVSAKVDGYEIKDILLTVGVAINIL